jgi:aminocarboxymuconate-semialdehyde decarboxylase
MGKDPAGIDIHGHAVPPRFLEEVGRRGLAGVSVASDDGHVVTFPGGEPLRAIGGIMLDFEDRFEWLEEQGMGQQIIAPWLDIHGQELSVHSGNEWVRALNDAMAEAVSGSGGWLHSYATLHLEDPESAGRELARAVGELEMVGCMLPTHPPKGSLADDSFDALWETASALRAPVVLHPPTVAPSRLLFDEYPQFRGTFGRGLDTTLAAAEMIVTGVFDRFPELMVVLVHGGGFLPYQVGRFDRDFGRGQEADKVQRLPSEYAASLYYDTVLLSASSLKLLFDLAGPKERAGIGLTDGLYEASPDEGARDEVLRRAAGRIFFAATDGSDHVSREETDNA